MPEPVKRTRSQARDRLAQQPGQLGVQFVLVGAGGAAIQHRLHGAPHARIAVAQQGRAVAATQVDVFAAVEVPDAAAVGAVEEHGVAERPVDARRGADAAGEILRRFFKLSGDSGHNACAFGLPRNAIPFYGKWAARF